MAVEFNRHDNPFSGLSFCLELFQNKQFTDASITRAYNEACNDPEHLAMFYSLLFSIGDITNRQHNIFHNQTVDNGGQSEREAFYIILNWMIKHDYPQFKKFLFAGLFNEYTCFDHLFRNRIKTTPQTKDVYKIYNMFSNSTYREDLAEYVVTIIKGNNPFNKMLVAKFLTLPRLGKRSGHKKMLQETYEVMKDKATFLKLLSDKLNWPYIFTDTYANFTGYRKWRSQYNGDLESVLFSTKKILEFDKLTFLSWIDKLPASARARVASRIYPKNDKWPILYTWYVEWLNHKATAQQEQRVLQEKVRQGTASIEEKVRLQEVKKEAHVTTGGTTLKELYDDMRSSSIDRLKLESFVENKVNLPYNFLTIIDDSGSMNGAPFKFASYLASVLLYKNPDDFGRNLIGLFNRETRFYTAIDRKLTSSATWYRHASSERIPKQPFIRPEESFLENYQRIDNFLQASFQGGGTYINSIALRIQEIAKSDPSIMDMIKSYPIWCIVSDSEFNNGATPVESIKQLQKVCKELDFMPYIIVIDVCPYSENNLFTGLDQVMYIPGKIELIEQMLSNFKDMDTFDAYTPLLSIYRSNRYAPVRNNIIAH